ncbi:MAG: AAA family ATPase, partial [Rhodothermales bacterium]
MSVENPFEFGRELSGSELVDRQEELDVVQRVFRERGRLFLIGPRRFGKTSLLRAAAERAERDGIVVLRHDAEAYPSTRLLAEGILSEAAQRLTGSIERAGKSLRDFFTSLRPTISFHPITNSFSASITAEKSLSDPALLTSVLDGLDRMASTYSGSVAVVIDEFQHVIEQGDGLATERQIRAAIQRHDHIAYVFAGSKTAMLAEMTSDAARPLYRLGQRLFLGPIPREDFVPFLKQSFED